jgi:hypothetical protein
MLAARNQTLHVSCRVRHRVPRKKLGYDIDCFRKKQMWIWSSSGLLRHAEPTKFLNITALPAWASPT